MNVFLVPCLWLQISRCYFKTFLLDIFFIYVSNVIPQRPLYPSPALLPNPPTPASWPRHSPVWGHMIFPRPKASPPIDGRLGHPLLHMQLETQFWEILVSSCCCLSYRVADPFSSLDTFSRSFIRIPLFHPIDDCEHPFLYLTICVISQKQMSLWWLMWV